MQKVGKFHPEWMFDYDTKVLPNMDGTNYRRQMLSEKIIHDGHTLIFRIDGFLKRCDGSLPYNYKGMYSIFGDKIKPLINDELIVDIDTERDLKLAKYIVSR